MIRAYSRVRAEHTIRVEGSVEVFVTSHVVGGAEARLLTPP
jgi:hypothetical protein